MSIRVTVKGYEKEKCYRIWIYKEKGKTQHLEDFKYTGDKERYAAWMDCLQAARNLEVSILEESNII